MSLESTLLALAESLDAANVHAPTLFSLGRGDDRRALEALLDAGRIRVVHDTILAQLAELVSTRAPRDKLAADALEERIRAHLGRVPVLEYGVWVHYPWSGRLVHVLPEPEFRELRSSRNKYKITPEEQARLGAAAIGIVGMSVGQTSALTLALEGIGGELRLADGDDLALSNLNRLRAGTHDISRNKCVIAAQAMFEIDPYLRIQIFPAGLTEDNVDDFLGGGAALDLLVEECDSLFMKILVRERARDRGIPVIMETNDRGMLDIERYDLDPDRPVLHGLLRGVRAAELRALTTREKVPHVLRILGARTLSPRIAASLVEIDQTVSSWAQLASGVMLGGALTADAARRVLLGDLQCSGRFYVDLEALVRSGEETPLVVDQELEEAMQRSPPRWEAPPPLVRRGGVPCADDLRTLVAYGVLAPSGGNAQPWRFVARGSRLRCHVVPERSRPLLDLGGSASLVAVGAAVENMILAAAAMGLRVEVAPFPDGNDESAVCDLLLGEDEAGPTAEARACADHIAARVANRCLGERTLIPAETMEELRRVAAASSGRLQLVTDPAALDEMGELLGSCDRLLFLSELLSKELAEELRWTTEAVERTRDGVDVLTLELSKPDLAGLRLMLLRRGFDLLAAMGKGSALEKNARDAVASASAMGLVTTPGVGAESYLCGGRVMERVWLTATARGLAIQPMSAMIYLFARLTRGGAEGLAEPEARALRDLQRRYHRIFDVAPDEAEILLFRIGVAAPPTARSLRRSVSDVLSFAEV